MPLGLNNWHNEYKYMQQMHGFTVRLSQSMHNTWNVESETTANEYLGMDTFGLY